MEAFHVSRICALAWRLKKKSTMEIINLCIEGLTGFDIITTTTICTLWCHAICDFFVKRKKKMYSTIFCVITLENNER